MICKRVIPVIIATILIFSSCMMTVKPGGTKSGTAALYETFFVGSDGTQYFINPLKFAGNNKEELLVDFTFKYKDQIKDSVICNFTIISDEKLKTVDKVSFVAGDINITCENITLLYNEKKGNKFASRFSGRLSADFNKLFNAGYFNVEVNNMIYKPLSKTQKSIKKLRDNLFVLFN